MTVEEFATDGRGSMPRTTIAASPHVSLLTERSVMEKNGSQLKRVCVEQLGKIAAVSVGVELARDMRNVVLGE